MSTTAYHPTPSTNACPSWCDVHTTRPEAERHDGILAQGVETETHGELYKVKLEDGDEGLKLWVEVNSVTLTADQAEALVVGCWLSTASCRSAVLRSGRCEGGLHPGRFYIRAEGSVHIPADAS